MVWLLTTGAFFVYSGERLPDAAQPANRRAGLIVLAIDHTTLASGLAMIWLLVNAGWARFAVVSILIAMSYVWFRRWMLVKALLVGLAFAYGMIALGFAMPNPTCGVGIRLVVTLQILLLFAAGTAMCDHKDTDSPIVDRQLRLLSFCLLGLGVSNGLLMLYIAVSWAGIFSSVMLGSLLLLPQATLRHPLQGPLLVDGLLVLMAVIFHL